MIFRKEVSRRIKWLHFFQFKFWKYSRIFRKWRSTSSPFNSRFHFLRFPTFFHFSSGTLPFLLVLIVLFLRSDILNISFSNPRLNVLSFASKIKSAFFSFYFANTLYDFSLSLSLSIFTYFIWNTKEREKEKVKRKD